MEEFKGQNMLSFIKEFSDDASCKAYLSKLKWQDGFTCTKCCHTKGCMKSDYKYECYQCHHVESATSNTLFHKVKFGLQKAFCMVFEMSTSSKSISSIQLGLRYNVSQTSTWFFMQKVRKAMQSSQNYLLENIVHVDEFVVGGHEIGKQGRSYNTKKKKAVIAVELTDNKKIKRAYIKAIDDYSSKSLTPIFEQHISTQATITTDKWRGYNKLKDKYNLTQVESNFGSNFKELHIVIQSIKSWIRAIPTHVSKKHAQAYYDEFCFRLNRSQFKETIFHKCIDRMIKAKPIFQYQLIQKLN